MAELDGDIPTGAEVTRARPDRSAQRRYEIVEAVLRENIAAGRLPRGLVLLEGPIAEILQTSRAPVQRALQRLEADGLVHRFEGRGFLVGPPGGRARPRRGDIKRHGLAVPETIDAALQQSRSSWQRIYDTVESDVAACLVFGQYRIVEVALAEHFGVSRTVVRDVLSRLQERGLVRKNQSSHWVAGPLTAETIKEHFALRRMLEPPALVSAAPRLDRGRLGELYERFRATEATPLDAREEPLETFETLLIDTCVLATPNARLAQTIRDNLLPVLATERLLRQLGLPSDRSAVTEHRLIVELLLRGAVPAAAAMLEAHLDAAMSRNIAQIKIVAVIPEPETIAAYLTRSDE
jgi:DNA-binding GntR family transcriptional regulator